MSAIVVNFLSSVKVSASFAASFARWSAISLPAIALCPGVQSICVGAPFSFRVSIPNLMSLTTLYSWCLSILESGCQLLTGCHRISSLAYMVWLQCSG